MARTKGARGRKNLPSNEQFKSEVKSLSMRLLRKIGVEIEEVDEEGKPVVTQAFLIKAANLVCSMHHSIVCDEEEEGGGKLPKGEQPKEDKPNYTQKLVDFSEKKAESDKKKASSK